VVVHGIKAKACEVKKLNIFDHVRASAPGFRWDVHARLTRNIAARDARKNRFHTPAFTKY